MIRSFAVSFLLFGLVSFVLALLPTDTRAVPAARSESSTQECQKEKQAATSNELRLLQGSFVECCCVSEALEPKI